MGKILYLIAVLWVPCTFAAGLTDVTGTWEMTEATVRGKPIDVNELPGYTAVVDETTWVDVEGGQRKTTYYYKAAYVAKQTRLEFCHDAELQKIEALAIVRMRDDVLEICMIDYSPGVQYPTTFESTEKNGFTVLKLKRKEHVTKPSEGYILISTLKTTVGKGQILVTGGYQNADGNFQYALVEPVLEQLPDGRKAIRIKSLQYSMSPEVIKELGLDPLNTNSRNPLQYVEVLLADELRSLNERIANHQGVGIMAPPQITVLPGKKAEMKIGEYKMSATPEISEDGSSFDIELRIEQPKDPNINEAPNPAVLDNSANALR